METGVCASYFSVETKEKTFQTSRMLFPGDSDRLALIWSASVYIPAATIAEHFGELGGRWQNPPLSNKAHQGLGRATPLRQNREIPPTSVFVWRSFGATLRRAIYSPYSLRQQTPE